MNDRLEDAVRDFQLVMKASKDESSEADMFKTNNENIKNMINRGA